MKGGTDMKKSLLASLMVVCLSGCSAHFGKINCQTIEVTENGSSVFRGYHLENYAPVYEYVCDGHGVIYTDYKPVRQVPRSDHTMESIPLPIYVYATAESKDYLKYEFSGEIGPIAYVVNLYLDLDTRTVETEYIYNDSAISYSQFRDMRNAGEAYECAKEDYYHIGYSQHIYLDRNQKGLECHYFTTFGEDAEITYTELK